MASSAAAAGPHFYAQQMNNSAASCIEIGLYDRAVTSLKRALRLSKAQQPSRNTLCECYQCTLDGCIVRSEELASSSSSSMPIPPSATPSGDAVEDRRTARGSKREGEDEDEGGAAASGERGYIHKTPIKVKCQGHTMGPALYLAITFNLALTNHLIALTHRNNPRELNKHAVKAKELYKLTYGMQSNLLTHERQKDPSAISLPFIASLRSIRFELILLNNTSQVFGLLTDQENEHDDYLQRLQSTMMIVVDHRVQTVGTHRGNRDTSANRLWRIDLECYLENTAHLVLEPAYTSSAA
jgi:hypothetical protein